MSRDDFKYPKFGQVVRDQMRAHNIKAKDVAAALDVTAQTLSAYRNGAYRPEDPQRLNKLARLLKVSREKLLSDDDTDTGSLPASNGGGASAPPTVAEVTVGQPSETETIIALKVLHRRFSAEEHERLWNYSLEVVDVALKGFRETFGNARPFVLGGNSDVVQREKDALAVVEAEAARLRAQIAGRAAATGSDTAPLRESQA